MKKYLQTIKENETIHICLIGAAIIIYATLFSYLSIAEHQELKSNMNDLGGFDQAMYETLHGNFMRNSSFFASEGTTNPSLLSKHSFYTQILFVPIYYFYQNPNIFLIFQALVVGLGALPLYWLGKLFFKNNILTLLIPFTYLLNPMVHDITLFDYHPIAIAMPIFMFAFYYLNTKSYGKFYLLAFLLALTKEDLSLTVAMFGIYMLAVQKEKLRGFIVFILSILFFFVNQKVLLPAFIGSETYVLITVRYSHLGTSGIEIVKTLLTKPWLLITYSISTLKVVYLTVLLIPVAFLPLISPTILALGIPALLINLLSLEPSMHSPFEQYYPATVIPFIYLASVYSLKKINSTGSTQTVQLITHAIIIFSFSLFVALSPTPFSLSSSWNEFSISQHARDINKLKALISADASLTIQNNLGPHFSQRENIYVFPYKSHESDFVLVDLYNPNPIKRSFRGLRTFRANISYLNFETIYFPFIESLFTDPNYKVIYFTNDGYLLFSKTSDNNTSLNDNAYLMYQKLSEEIIIPKNNQ